MVEPKYKRILIKLSGEALAGERGVGIDIKTVQNMAQEIKEVHELGIEIALVIGGGNLWRGYPCSNCDCYATSCRTIYPWSCPSSP